MNIFKDPKDAARVPAGGVEELEELEELIEAMSAWNDVEFEKGE